MIHSLEGDFFTNLTNYMELTREFLKKRYAFIASQKCSSNPMAYCQGGIYNGHKDPSEEVGDIVLSFTASFGITALNELNILHEGKPLHESDHVFVNEVLDFMNSKIEQYKKEDGYLYALYGTPAESLCATQCSQYKEYFGDHEICKYGYFSNSFHMHVTAPLNPFDKQDEEFELFHKVNGGHIQYVRINDKSSINAVKWIVIRGLYKGFYQGINTVLSMCSTCGSRETGLECTCPECGSDDIVELSRLCGYIGYARKNGGTRIHSIKMKEIRERASM